MNDRISVIVPAWNEAARTAAHLAALRMVPGLFETVVADGGSMDDTAGIARAVGALVIDAPRGRGPQMNAGARVAKGEILLFLHADAHLPAEAATRVIEALDRPGTVGGAFTTRTVVESESAAWPRLVRLADLRSRYTRLPYGDQAIFVRRSVFDSIGGFPAQPLFEDVEFSRRLRRAGRVHTVRRNVVVSGRRFEQRPVYFALMMNLLPLLYRLGVSPRRLARLYGDVR